MSELDESEPPQRNQKLPGEVDLRGSRAVHSW
jgi:hypothetical protein